MGILALFLAFPLINGLAPQPSFTATKLQVKASVTAKVGKDITGIERVNRQQDVDVN